MLFNFYRSSLRFVRSPIRSLIRKTSSISIFQHDCIRYEAWGRCIRNVKFHCAVERQLQNWKKKKESRELYVPFPRSATTAFTASSFNVLFHISPKRSETRRKCIFPEEEECAFHSPRIRFLCCKLVTVPVNSATANKAWWNNCRLVLRDKRVDRLTRLLL